MANERVGTLVHVADLHLGAPLESLGSRLGADEAENIRVQSHKAFDRLVDLTIQQQADILVMAGDVYDEAEKEARAQLRFSKAMRKLTDAGVKVFVAHGNHDPITSSYEPVAALPDEVVVFGENEPQLHQVKLKSGSEISVVGVSFGRKHEDQNLARRFHGLSCDPTQTIGVLHTNVGSNSVHGNYAPCSKEDLEVAPVGYWALGHIHDRQVHSMGPGRWWAYSGNLQGRSTKATECGPKGALVVPILSDGFGEPVFHPCDTVRFERVDVDVSEAQNLQEAFEIIDDRLRTLEDSANGRVMVARIRLIGTSLANGQIREQTDLIGMIREFLTTSVHLAKIEVTTRPKIDRDQLLQRNDLLSDILLALDQTVFTSEQLLEIVEDQMPAKAAKRLMALLSERPELAADVMEQVELLLIECLEESQ